MLNASSMTGSRAIGASREVDPNRLSVREIRFGQCECVGKPLRDLGGKSGRGFYDYSDAANPKPMSF